MAQSKQGYVSKTNYTWDPRFDGIVIATSDWSAIKNLETFNLENLVCHVQWVKGSDFKGLDLGVEDYEAVKIRLGKIQNMTAYFVARLQRKDQQKHINFEAIAKDLVQLQNDIVKNGMIPTAPTRKNWPHHREGAEKQHQRIWPEDIEFFGNKFLEGATQIFEGHCDKVAKHMLVLAEFGQDAEFDTITDRMNYFDLEKLDQLIIHYAKDFEVAGHALFWKSKNLAEKLDPTNQQSKYSVCLLNGVGNFYYRLPQIPYIAHKFVEIKFYNEAFKYVHRQQKPFGSPKIAMALFQPNEFGLGFCKRQHQDWGDYMHDIRIVQDALQQIHQKPSLKARAETIVKLSNDDITEHNISNLPRAVTKHPKLLPTNDLVDCLKMVKMDDIINHLDTNLIPPLRNLSFHVNNRLAAVKSGEMNVLNPDEYQAALVSEAILTFCLYGNASFVAGTKMYDTRLVKMLGITPLAYCRSDTDSIGSWMFPNVDESTLSVNASVANFTSPHDIIKTVLREGLISEDIGKPLLQLAVWSLEKTENPQLLSNVSAMIIQCIEKTAIHYGKSNEQSTSNCIQKLLHQYSNPEIIGKCIYNTSMDFVQGMFHDSKRFAKHGFLRWVIGIIKTLLAGRFELEELKLQIRNDVENLLFLKLSPFPFPIDDPEFKFLLIIPQAGTVAQNYQQITPDNLQDLILRIQVFLPNTIPGHVIQDILTTEKDYIVPFSIILRTMHERAAELRFQPYPRLSTYDNPKSKYML